MEILNTTISNLPLKFILSGVIIIILARQSDFQHTLYNKYKQEKNDIIFHIVHYSLQFFAVYLAMIAFNVSIEQLRIITPLAIATLWIILDIWWSLKNKKPFYYSGDGKGAIIEKFFNFLHPETKDRILFTWIYKTTFLLLSITYYLLNN